MKNMLYCVFLCLLFIGVLLKADEPEKADFVIIVETGNNTPPKYGFIDPRGVVRVKPQFTGALDFSEGLAAVRQDRKWGYIGLDGKMVITPQFDEAESFSNGLAVVSVKHKKGFIDKQGHMVIKPMFDYAHAFSEGLAYVEKRVPPDPDDNSSSIPLHLRSMTAYEYFKKHGTPPPSSQSQPVVPMRKDIPIKDLAYIGMLFQPGYIDKTGKMIIRLPFGSSGDRFINGLALVSVPSGNKLSSKLKRGFIDRTGKMVIPSKFDFAAQFSQGLANVAIDGKFGFIDKTGKIVIPLQFNVASSFYAGLAAVQLEKKWGYIDRTGKFVIFPQFTTAGPFIEGLAVVQYSDKLGYINQKGEMVIAPRFVWAKSFSEGRAQIGIFRKKFFGSTELKHGYIDNAGKMVIEPQYDEAENFRHGLAKVRQDRKMLYVDKTGKVVWESLPLN